MAEKKVVRRLAAIVATDMVGSSRLMELDEAGTIARQKAHRKQLIDPKIAEHNGRVVKSTGDGLLLEFASAVDAVQCAVEVQRAMPKLEVNILEDRRITYRVGINVGDIVVEDDDIYGDGVNVAARLQMLAEPGGICISRPVFTQIKNKVELGFVDLGPQKVKNIAEPVQTYKVLLDPVKTGTVVKAKRSLPRRLRWAASTTAAALLVVAAGIAWWQPVIAVYLALYLIVRRADRFMRSQKQSILTEHSIELENRKLEIAIAERTRVEEALRRTILDVSDSETGDVRLPEPGVNVAETVGACRRIIEDRAKEARLTFETRMRKGLPRLQVNERVLKQILLNLLSNAVKFTPEGGRISVDAKVEESGSLIVLLSDTGIGMDAKDIEEALSPTSHIANQSTPDHRKLRRGLPLVKSLIEAQGGALELKSELGRGTIVTMRFPAELTCPRA